MKSRPLIANLVGVDAGGSKTAAAFAQDGAVVRSVRGPAANPTLIGVDDAADAIVRTIRDAASRARIDAVFVGAAGAGSAATAAELESLIGAAFSRAKVRVGDDVEIALRAAIPAGAGIALVAGTGSIALASDIDGKLHRVGGLGYLLGDEGSASWIGLEAVRLLGRVFDGRARDEETAKLVARHLGVADRAGLIAAMYAERLDVARLAALAPGIIAFAGKGNRTSREIVQRAAEALVQLVCDAARVARLDGAGPKVALSGGLLREQSVLRDMLEDGIVRGLGVTEVIRGGDPLEGALRCAAALLPSSP